MVPQPEHNAHEHEMSHKNLIAHMEDYKALVRIACMLTSEPSLDHLLDLVIEESNQLLQADRSSLFLVDTETDELYSKIALGTGEIRLKIGTGLSGTAAQTGEIINIRDAQNDPRHNRKFDLERGYTTHTILTVPMRNHAGKIIGVIQAINKREGIFSERDEEVLTAFASIAAAAIENATLRRDIQMMLASFIETMADTIDMRSPQTAGHSRRVATYAAEIAREMGMPQDSIDLLWMAGLLHDYGKIGVPEAVLTKPGRLTEEEWIFMRQHVEKSEEMLSKIYLMGALKRLPVIAGQHHERVNGTGYPYGLKDEQIEPEAKILAVADVYDALTIKRYYRNPMTHLEALEYLRTLIGKEFSEECVEAMVRVVARIGPPQNPYEDTAIQFFADGANGNPPDVSRFIS